MELDKSLQLIGWREWVALPELGIPRIKAKVDTGARSSSLHAYDLHVFRRGDVEVVRFKVHPMQRSSVDVVHAEATVLEYRSIRSSTGHVRRRPVIVTRLNLLNRSWEIELTLANRDEMGFRMLLGREAIRRRFCVDAGRSYYGGQPTKKRSSVRDNR